MSMMNTPQPMDDAWLRRMADAEEQCPSISVGGMAVDVGLHSGAHEPGALAAVNAATALARLVELWRRQQQLTVEEFAKRSGLTEAEVVGIESGELIPEPRALLQLSQVIPVSYDKLLHVAGHVQQRDERLCSGAVRFAARSEPMEALTRQEEEALRDFVNLLAR